MSKKFREIAEKMADQFIRHAEAGYHSDLEPFASFAEREKRKIVKSALQFNQDFKNGYQIIIDHLETAEDKEECRLTEEKLAAIEDLETVRKEFEQKKTYQDLLGYSDDAMAKMYNVCAALHRQESYEEAVQGMRFITTLNPYISFVWTALGNTLLALYRDREALLAYEMAIATDGGSVERYVDAADCCRLLKDDEEEKKIWELAVQFAQSENNAELEEAAQAHLSKK